MKKGIRTYTLLALLFVMSSSSLVHGDKLRSHKRGQVIDDSSGMVVKLITPEIDDNNESVDILKDCRIYVETFTDVRSDYEGDVIGFAYTGMLNDDSPVIAEEDLEYSITKNIKDRFLGLGLTLVNNKGDADLVLKGRINRFNVSEISDGYMEHSVAAVEFDFLWIDNKLKEKLWYDVKRIFLVSPPSSMDSTKFIEELINEALIKVIDSSLDNSVFSRVYKNIVSNNAQ